MPGQGRRWGEAAWACLVCSGGTLVPPRGPPACRPGAVAGPGRALTDGGEAQGPLSLSQERCLQGRTPASGTPACLLPAAGGLRGPVLARSLGSDDGNSSLWSPGSYRYRPVPRPPSQLPQGPSEPVPRAASHGGGPVRSHPSSVSVPVARPVPPSAARLVCAFGDSSGRTSSPVSPPLSSLAFSAEAAPGPASRLLGLRVGVEARGLAGADRPSEVPRTWSEADGVGVERGVLGSPVTWRVAWVFGAGWCLQHFQDQVATQVLSGDPARLVAAWPRPSGHTGRDLRGRGLAWAAWASPALSVAIGVAVTLGGHSDAWLFHP